jgi:hypothetical protein
MKNSIFCSKNLIKYLIIVGLVYAILKMIPSEQLSNKDLILIMIITVLGLFSLDCMFLSQKKEDFDNSEGDDDDDDNEDSFANVASKQQAASKQASPNAMQSQQAAQRAKMQQQSFMQQRMNELQQPNMPAMPAMQGRQMQGNMPAVPAMQGGQMQGGQMQGGQMQGGQMQGGQMQGGNMAAMMGGQMQVGQMQGGNMPAMMGGQMQSNMQSNMMQTKAPLDANVIASTPKEVRDPLAATPLDAGMPLTQPANYIPDPKNSKCAPSPCAAEVEALKKQLEAQINVLKDQLQTSAQQKVNNDFRYNELPLEMYVPIGDKVANKWSTDNAYSMLNTNQWQVPMPRPPVCINTEPCKVCPTDEGAYGPVPSIPLTKFDTSRVISDTKINRQWANDQRAA